MPNWQRFGIGSELCFFASKRTRSPMPSQMLFQFWSLPAVGEWACKGTVVTLFLALESQKRSANTTSLEQLSLCKNHIATVFCSMLFCAREF